MARLLWGALRLLFFPLAIAPLAAQKRAEPLRIADLLSATRLPPGGYNPTVATSPDGRWVAYVQIDGQASPQDTAAPRNPDVEWELAGATLWVIDLNTQQTRQLRIPARTTWAPTWAPDGHRLAFLGDGAGKTRLWIWSPAAGAARMTPDVQVIGGGPGTLRWLGDSRTILTTIPPTRSKAETEPDRARPVRRSRENPADTPTVHVLRHIPTAAVGTAADTASISVSPQAKRKADIALVDVESGRAERLAREVSPTWYDLSPDGRRLAFTAFRGMISSDINNRSVFDLIVVDRASGAAHVAAHNVLMHFFGGWVRWSPDSRRLAYVGGERPVEPPSPQPIASPSTFRVPGYCFVVPAEGGLPQQIGQRAIVNRASAPLWDPGGKVIYALGADTLWRLDPGTGAIAPVAAVPGHAIVTVLGFTATHSSSGSAALSPPPVLVHARDRQGRTEGLYRVDLTTGAVRTVVEAPQRFGAVGAAARADVIAFQGEDVAYPADVWVVGPSSPVPVQLTHLNPTLEQHRMGTGRVISWRSMDGDSVRGLLLLPSDYAAGQRYPTVTWPYAGANFGTEFQHSFGVFNWINATYNAQLLATRGYAVFIPDIPIRLGTPMTDIAKVVLPGIDRIVDLGIADPDRLGLWGQSHGGYTVLSLLVQSSRFRAAVTGASGWADLFASYELLYPDGTDEVFGWAEQGQGAMGGSPWEYRDRYVENSPFFYLDRINAPLLEQYGSEDNLAPASKAVFVALRRLNKRVELIAYQGEDHVVLAPANQIDYWNRASAWFDEYLAPRAHPPK
jgi:dipeptidyl aminopeptidase/acylaminoacyl peptidase